MAKNLFRRSELSPTLLSQADKHHWGDSIDSTEFPRQGDMTCRDFACPSTPSPMPTHSRTSSPVMAVGDSGKKRGRPAGRIGKHLLPEVRVLHLQGERRHECPV